MITENQIATILVDLFIKVHRGLGPGLLESVYEEALSDELDTAGLSFMRQQGIHFYYKRKKMDIGFRADLIVENKVIVEIKSVDQLAPIHFKVLTTYLKLSGLKLGLLVNFNTVLVKDGISRIVNNL